MKITPEIITSLNPNEIFVFGSNLKGLHYGGAARFAMNFGAELGNGVGIQGNTYAIPTMGEPGNRKTKLSIPDLAKYVNEFIAFAKKNPNLHFFVTPIGCGIAGFNETEIAPLFKKALNLKNVSLPMSFLEVLGVNIKDNNYEKTQIKLTENKLRQMIKETINEIIQKNS